MADIIPYEITKTDVDAIVGCGYKFIGIEPNGFGAFMRTHLRGFDVLRWIEKMEELLLPVSDTPVTRLIVVQSEKLQVRFENEFKDESDALILDRCFYRDEEGLKVSHEYLVIPEAARSNQLAKKVMAISLPFYEAMGADVVEVVAGLSAGPYVWAKYGFTAVHRADMEKIRLRCKLMLQPGEYELIDGIFTAYYNREPVGKAFPIQRWANLDFMKHLLMNPECEWAGRLHLKNSEQLRKFEEHVNR